MFQNGNLGGEKKSLNPLHRIRVPMLVLEHFLSLSPFSALMMSVGEVLDAAAPLAKGELPLLPCPIVEGRARSVMELTQGERPDHAWNL